MTWVEACKVVDLDEDEAYKLEVQPPVAIFNVDGEFYATDDMCTHGESSLSEGYLEDGQIECIFHFARFCVRTGVAQCLPATVDLRTYATKVEDDQVWVDLPDDHSTAPVDA
ncbi:bifunctional 3-phenylpropionate/cinnamic acid dioxygenase ferredoxin subunit [Aeromicrobium wangtongii]|uniref:bifunctional 3-phenylpropionate/cinnamic acid dioxygenase ferredoxin subunit n=1 Tax=Aeromicrobium wangtongii TaxID=2969247 RepID=UPI002016EDCB|nr:bifunctional 3-phenylpropionate/cinnamic acid dioxygenase ferredoxin subunit [Aeromicrobium wangtongii]MCL3819417.1 bifunctional 3-phenylpropionate/cinnamic acid dioxygenase ferredoxin subunit [Aeromicrobium wangtongii]